MVSLPLDGRFWLLVLPRLISRVALPAVALVSGCSLGFGALCVWAWLWVDPGCHCPGEKIEAARALANQFFPVGLVLSAVLSLGFFFIGKRLLFPSQLSSPSVVSLAFALLVSGLLGFVPGAGGRFSRVPIEWVVPQPLMPPTRVLSDTLQSWKFVIFVVLWVAAYLAIRGLRSRVFKEYLDRLRKQPTGSA